MLELVGQVLAYSGVGLVVLVAGLALTTFVQAPASMASPREASARDTERTRPITTDGPSTSSFAR